MEEMCFTGWSVASGMVEAMSVVSTVALTIYKTRRPSGDGRVPARSIHRRLAFVEKSYAVFEATGEGGASEPFGGLVEGLTA